MRRSYQLVSASSPTVPLHGNDFTEALYLLNELLESYASDGLLLTIAKTITVPMPANQNLIVCGPADYVPTPQITAGRLANINNAWLLLNGMTYPLEPLSKDVFLASYKYAPLESLPRFVIYYPETEVTTLQVYPGPSQFYEFNVRGKFQLTEIQPNDELLQIPKYYQKFLRYALAKQIAYAKGRSKAWTKDLQMELDDEEKRMDSASDVNLSIYADTASMLNGAYRVRAGV